MSKLSLSLTNATQIVELLLQQIVSISFFITQRRLLEFSTKTQRFYHNHFKNELEGQLDAAAKENNPDVVSGHFLFVFRVHRKRILFSCGIKNKRNGLVF